MKAQGLEQTIYSEDILKLANEVASLSKTLDFMKNIPTFQKNKARVNVFIKKLK